MSRGLIAVGLSMALSMAFLAACEVDDDADDVADDPVGVEDVADDAITDDPDVSVVDDEDDAITDDPDDALTDDEDDAVTDDSDDAIADDADEAMVDDDDIVAEDAIDVVLTGHEINMETEIEAGTVTFELTNDGDVPHGIAIMTGAPATDADENSANEENGELLSASTIAPGESTTLPVELEGGEYTVFCPVGEHREEGMEELLTVE